MYTLRLPNLLDAEDAISLFKENNGNDSLRAYRARWLNVNLGLKNRQLCNLLGVDSQYVSYLLSSKRLTDDEMLIWIRNSNRISLSHIRSISTLRFEQRQPLLKKLTRSHISSRAIENQVRDLKSGVPIDTEEFKTDFDLDKYAETISEHIGRPTQIIYDQNKQVGTINLKFFKLDDLERVLGQLGYTQNEDDF